MINVDSHYIEIALILILFLIYFFLRKHKKNQMLKQANIDPEVIKTASSNIQKYMNKMFNILTGYIIILIVLHATNRNIFDLLHQRDLINQNFYDYLGFSIGVIGLGICYRSQRTMGNSRRVGIDEKNKSQLIKTGLYKIIRNPTYLGIFLLNLGIRLIWPNILVTIRNTVFILLIEVQVRCEEDFLEKEHNTEYKNYKKKTRRYIPFVY